VSYFNAPEQGNHPVELELDLRQDKLRVFFDSPTATENYINNMLFHRSAHTEAAKKRAVEQFVQQKSLFCVEVELGNNKEFIEAFSYPHSTRL